LVEQILQGVGRRSPGLAHQNLRGGAVDDADIGPVLSADHRIDLLGSLGIVQAGVAVQDVDGPVRGDDIVGDVRLGLHDYLGDIFVPRNHGRETVLQGHHFVDQCPEFAVGSIGGATRPDTSVEDFGPLIPAGLQNVGDVPQNLRVLLRPVIEGLLIDLRPPARIEHLLGVPPRRLGETHQLLLSQRGTRCIGDTNRAGDSG
jgi:hypothetical protein